MDGDTPSPGGDSDQRPMWPPVPVAGEARAVEASPVGYFWLYYMFFRPRTFFRHFVIESHPLLTALCAWTFGMTGVIDRVDTEMLSEPTNPFYEDWTAYWTFVALGGILAGLIYFGIGGWWFRVRLGWSGAVVPDAPLARRVYVFASQVLALPILVFTLHEASSYPTPIAASNSEDSWWYLVIIGFAFWSVWTSYVGVRTAFEVRPGSARTWFLILPSVFYGILFAGAIGLAALLSFGPADTDNPQQFESPTMRFSYPGNWWIDTESKDFEASGNVTIEPTQDAAVTIMIHESDESVADVLSVTIEVFKLQFSGWVDGSSSSAWGAYVGNGRSARAKLEGRTYEIFFFITEAGPARYLKVYEMYLIDDEKDVYPGIELIRSTFSIK